MRLALLYSFQRSTLNFSIIVKSQSKVMSFLKKSYYSAVFVSLFINVNAQITEINGQTFKTIAIGTQTWMAENLNVDRFRNGDPIPEAKSDAEWKLAGINKQPAWCYYNNDPKNGEKYGKLYNWYAVNDPRGLAPEGYVIPTKENWETLKAFLGDHGGLKLKSTEKIEIEISYYEIDGYYEEKFVPCSNCSYWTKQQKLNNPCTACKNQGGKYIKTGKYIPKSKQKIETKKNTGWDGTNESGFSAFPSYWRSFDGGFTSSCGAKYWSSSEYEKFDYVYSMELDYGKDHLLIWYVNDKPAGFAVRCIKH